MDRQKIFDGLLDTFEAINDEMTQHQDNEFRQSENFKPFFARLLAMGELLREMNETFEDIELEPSAFEKITRTISDLRNDLFTQKELEILNSKEPSKILDLLINTSGLRSYSIMQDYKSILSDMNEEINLNLIKLVYRAVAEKFITVRNYFVALASIELTLEFNPDSAEDYLRQGEIFKNLTLYDDAIEAYEKALKLDPHHKEAQFSLDQVIAIKESKDLATALQPLSSQQKIIDAYENRIKEIEDRLKWLREKSQQFQIGLFITLIMIWLGLYWLTYPQDSASQQVSYFLLILSISSTTLLLVSPVIWTIRRLHHDMKIERIVMEDIIRKRDILLLRLLHSGTPHSPEAREMVAKNSNLVIAHNVDRGTADILQELYSNKPAKAGDDSSANSQNTRLLSAIERLLGRQSQN